MPDVATLLDGATVDEVDSALSVAASELSLAATALKGLRLTPTEKAQLRARVRSVTAVVDALVVGLG